MGKRVSHSYTVDASIAESIPRECRIGGGFTSFFLVKGSRLKIYARRSLPPRELVMNSTCFPWTNGLSRPMLGRCLDRNLL